MRKLLTRKVLLISTMLIGLLYIYKTFTTTSLYDHSLIKYIRVKSAVYRQKSGLKYILLWTSVNKVPFEYMGLGQEGFIKRKCPYTNCYVTGDKTLLVNYTNFDVIAFAGPEVNNYHKKHLPAHRSEHQKFVYATIESADIFPVCSNRFNGYFNWTWTYKLDSEVRWGYIVIRDKDNNIVGPNKIMHWKKLKDMEPISNDFKNQLKSKTRAVAWFVSNCHTRNLREIYVEALQRQLKKYSLHVDIYGACGPFKCSRKNKTKCDNMIKNTYYFYLSFENSFSEDYVTEKLLRALQNDAVPIVYGGANYSRFMPDGIYLDAREIDVVRMARKIRHLINDPDKYFEYFKWKKYYSYHRQYESVATEPYCLFCTILNDEKMVKTNTVYNDFKNWWDPLYRC